MKVLLNLDPKLLDDLMFLAGTKQVSRKLLMEEVLEEYWEREHERISELRKKTEEFWRGEGKL